MYDISKRFLANPLLSPTTVAPSAPYLNVICLLNPGAFKFKGKTWLLARVAETIVEKEKVIWLPTINSAGKIEAIEVPIDHPELITSDPRVFNFKGLDYLTTISHLRLFSSVDGIHFEEDEHHPPIFGKGKLEAYGIEDCRVAKIADTFYLTYTAVSANGVGIKLKTTTDWQCFEDHGMIFPPHNKDCAIFEEKIDGVYYALHRPSSVAIGGNYIWLASSPDGIHWGRHTCILRTRPNEWDNARIGAGASPIKTEKGWLAIYHGANLANEYCLGAFLMDLNDPSLILARTANPIMQPTASYETSGFFGNVVFTNGHLVEGDLLTIYYGAADEFICGAHFSIKEILASLIYFN